MVPSHRRSRFARGGPGHEFPNWTCRPIEGPALSFRYIDGIVIRISAGNVWESNRNKVAAGMNPAAVAALLTLR